MNNKLFLGKALLLVIVMGGSQVCAQKMKNHSHSSRSQQKYSQSYIDQAGNTVQVEHIIENHNGVTNKTIKKKQWQKDGIIRSYRESYNPNQGRTIVEKVRHPDGSKLMKETIVKSDGSVIQYELKTDQNGEKTFTQSTHPAPDCHSVSADAHAAQSTHPQEEEPSRDTADAHAAQSTHPQEAEPSRDTADAHATDSTHPQEVEPSRDTADAHAADSTHPAPAADHAEKDAAMKDKLNALLMGLKHLFMSSASPCPVEATQPDQESGSSSQDKPAPAVAENGVSIQVPPAVLQVLTLLSSLGGKDNLC